MPVVSTVEVQCHTVTPLSMFATPEARFDSHIDLVGPLPTSTDIPISLRALTGLPIGPKPFPFLTSQLKLLHGTSLVDGFLGLAFPLPSQPTVAVSLSRLSGLSSCSCWDLLI